MHRHTETGIRRRSRRFGSVAAALGLLTAAACTAAPGSSLPSALTPEVTQGTVSVATWNMCGVEQWDCEDKGSPSDKFQQLRALAEGRGVRVMLLQEVCSQDLLSSAVRLGPEWHSVFEPYVTVDARGSSERVDCTGEGRGMAGFGLLAASPVTDVQVIEAAQPKVGLHRGIVCAQVPVQGLRVCNAHIALRESDVEHPDWDFRDDQLGALVTAAAADPRTVFGGDFNAPPPVGERNTAAWIWPAEAYTTYRECDQEGDARTGRRTHTDGTKIDYLFTALPRTGCTVVDTKASDHRPLVMRVERPEGTG